MKKSIQSKKNDTIKSISGINYLFLVAGRWLSIIFHPIFLFYYCFLFIHISFASNRFGIFSLLILLVIFIITVLLPAVYTLVYAKDIYLTNRRKRPKTILFTLLCYGICFILFNIIDLKDIYFNGTQDYYDPGNVIRIYLRLYFIMMTELLILALISYKFKISLHASGIGFFLALSFMYGLPWEMWHRILPGNIFNFTGLFILLCCALLLWERIASGSHRIIEVISGLTLGFGITFLFDAYIH